MEGGVASPPWMDYRPVLLTHRRIVGFQAKVKSEQEIREVKSETGSIACSYLAPECGEMKHSSGLVLIVVDSPDITRVGKYRSLKHPEEPTTIFDIEKQGNISTLIDEVCHRVAGII